MRFFKEKTGFACPAMRVYSACKSKNCASGRKENISIIKNEKCSARKTQKMRHKNTIFRTPKKIYGLS